jgi:very-short-patch-repair endonuclease
VIFLSVGFGKDAAGKMSLNFGALNDEGGWRRLNVLITRARRRCVVYSSIRHDDIDLANTGSRGVASLKEYLYAAEHGRLRDQPPPGRDHDSEFEATVCQSLRDRGWEVHPKVGCAGFAIDLAVVDPRAPGRYLLGIECDGATYRSSPTARDRDRLRRAVLEGLGWQIHRVWSTDWFQRPASVLEAMLQRLETLKNQPLDSAIFHFAPAASERTEPASAVDVALRIAGAEQPAPADPLTGLPPGIEPYTHHRDAAPRGDTDDLLQLSAEELSVIVKELVEIEGPIHEDEAMRVVAEMFQARVSPRSREAFDRALGRAIEFGLISRKEEFLWSPDKHELKIRHRGEPCPVTKPEWIPPEELEAAVRLAIRQQYGLKSEAAVDCAARLLGFPRTGPKLKAAFEQAMNRLGERGEVELDASGYITLKEA